MLDYLYNAGFMKTYNELREEAPEVVCATRVEILNAHGKPPSTGRFYARSKLASKRTIGEEVDKYYSNAEEGVLDFVVVFHKSYSSLILRSWILRLGWHKHTKNWPTQAPPCLKAQNASTKNGYLHRHRSSHYQVIETRSTPLAFTPNIQC